MKKIISILLVLLMTVSILPLGIMAEDAITDGVLTWSYDETTKTLTVSGEGDMPDYEWIEPDDWKEDNMRLPKEWTRAEHVVIEEGVTSIGDWAFMRFGAMSDITLPETLTKIGKGAFEYTHLDYIEFPSSLCELEGCFWSSEPPKIIIFKGDAPNLDNWTDFSITVTFEKGDLTTIYYPKENTTWTEDVKEAFGPRITWNDEAPPKPTAGDVFDDIKVDTWYYESVQYVYERGFMIGTTPHTFAPGAELTRAQAMQMLFNMSGEDPEDYKGETGFDDVSANAWCAPAVKWAVENRITNGIRTYQFAPNQLITRQQLATMLYNYKQDLDVKTFDTADLSAYEDASEVQDWADTGIKWCVAQDIITGMSETKLAPQANVTRAQTARMMGQFHKHALNNMPVFAGGLEKIADYVAENGEIIIEAEKYKEYHYTLIKDNMKLVVESVVRPDYTTISLNVSPVDTDEHGYDSTRKYSDCFRIHLLHYLQNEYQYSYHCKTPDEEITSVGNLTHNGFEAERLYYYVWNGSKYVKDVGNQHIGMEKRDMMIAYATEFIEQLLDECGVSYSELFINGDL